MKDISLFKKHTKNENKIKRGKERWAILSPLPNLLEDKGILKSPLKRLVLKTWIINIHLNGMIIRGTKEALTPFQITILLVV